VRTVGYTPATAQPPVESMDRRDVAGPVLAVALVLAGTLATGVLPPTTPYQVLAGGLIVAGFALLMVLFWD